MAIPFMMASVISAGWPEDEEKRRPRAASVVAASAYVGRRRLKSSVTGKTYDYRRGHSGVLHSEILLPEGADPRFGQPGRLWSAAERAEWVYDRKTKEWRFRLGGEMGRSYKIALPKEFTLDENIGLIREFVQREFVDRGLAAEIVIHPSDDSNTGNIHAHVLVTSRPIQGKTFGNRATETQPEFICPKGGKGFVAQPSHWPQRWAAAQERYFATHGIPLSVDPISICPREHEGRGRHLPDSNAQSSNRASVELEQELLRDPRKLLEHLSERLAVFSLKDILRLLRKAGILGMEARRIAWEILQQEEVMALDPPGGGRFKYGQAPRGRGKEWRRKRADERRFTTRAIIEQEQRIQMAIREMTNEFEIGFRRLPSEALETAERLIAERGLDPEQADAVRYCLQSHGIAQVQGRAGAGKSYASAVIVEALTEANRTVIGLAPTNQVAGAMRRDGCPEALTLHRFLMQLEGGRRRIGSWTVLMVDEAAMVDVGIYDRLLTAAAKEGCHVMLIGDDRQLTPVGRGGIYGLIRRELGAVEMKNVRRQKIAWMRDASIRLSEWDVGPAIELYDQHGHVTWTETLIGAANQLVEDWGTALAESPDKPLFVYAGTNHWVGELNRRLQVRRWRNVPHTAVHKFECDAGAIGIRIGERLQFRANDAARGIFNGVLATVTAVDAAGVHVSCDDGTTTSFDPGTFTGWDLGYAGTCYRGQGKTQDRTFLFYDHSFVWGAATTYVGLTRHREHAQLYVPRELARNRATLIRQMSRGTEQLLASDLEVCTDQSRAKDDLFLALYPVEPPIHLEIRFPDGRRDKIDIVPEAASAAALRHFEKAGVEEFVPDYLALTALARAGSEHGPAEMLRRRAAEVARKRGFRPSNGKVDPTCLRHVLSNEDMEDHERGARLRGDGKTEIDVEPLAFSPGLVQESLWIRVARRLRELDDFVLDAILDRVHALRGALARSEAMTGALGLAAYLVKMSRAVKGGATGTELAEREGDIRAEEPAPRLVWKPFRLWRKDADGELYPLEDERSHPARAFADVMAVPKWNAAEIQQIEADERAAVLGGAGAAPRQDPRSTIGLRAGAAR